MPGPIESALSLLLDKAGNEDNWSGLTGPQIRQLRQAHSLEDVMGVNEWNLTVTGGDVPEDVRGNLPDTQRLPVPWFAGDVGP